MKFVLLLCLCGVNCAEQSPNDNPMPRLRGDRKLILCDSGQILRSAGTGGRRRRRQRCRDCLKDKFADSLSNSCKDCPPGQYSQPRSATCKLNDCKSGKFMNHTTEQCELCKPGHFSGGQTTACAPCPSGQFANGEGNTQCTGTSCAVGRFGPVAQTDQKESTCKDCPDSLVAKMAGAGECRKCEKGSYPVPNNNTNSTEKTTCFNPRCGWGMMYSRDTGTCILRSLLIIVLATCLVELMVFGVCNRQVLGWCGYFILFIPIMGTFFVSNFIPLHDMIALWWIILMLVFYTILFLVVIWNQVKLYFTKHC
jgi:hypothetical protein